MGFLLLLFSERPPWWDVAWATWALVFVGLGGTIAAIWTLLTIRRQTTAIERQVHEMQSTSIQTDRLIEEATKQSIAAKKSAEALINTERAWIMVEIEPVPGISRRMVSQSSDGRSCTSVRIRFNYTNEGKTIAWIDEKLACFQILKELPKQPDFSALTMLDCVPEWVGIKGGGQLDHALQVEGQEDMEDISVIWGVIRYRDAFNSKHETIFGFRICPDDRFERIAGLLDYNKST
jgi:hypothetical protein